MFAGQHTFFALGAWPFELRPLFLGGADLVDGAGWFIARLCARFCSLYGWRRLVLIVVIFTHGLGKEQNLTSRQLVWGIFEGPLPVLAR